ncbi:MAG: PAS domain S-box protein, partial [Balneolales bacterium]
MQKDSRIKHILRHLSHLSESGDENDIDAIIPGLNTLTEQLHIHSGKDKRTDERTNAFLDVLSRYTVMDFSGKGDIGGKRDEIDAIAAGFDAMTEAIRISYEILKKDKAQNINLTEDVEDYAILLLDPNGVITNWNKGAREIKGYTAKEAIGNNFKIFYTAEDQESGKPQTMLDKAIKYGKAKDEGYRQRKDGTLFWGSIVITTLRNKDNEVIGFTKVTRDLSELKGKEDRLRLRASQLEATNKELESFTYSVSHDLRAPLRAVHGYSQMLIEDYNNKLDDEGNRILNVIMSNAKMMGKLIDDLLAFSRLGRTELNKTNLNLNELVNGVVTNLNELENHNAHITIDPLPNIYADQNLITQVFLNLISNAVKYSSKKENPRIRIGTVNTEKGQAFFVSDNGAGFDMEFYDK